MAARRWILFALDLLIGVTLVVVSYDTIPLEALFLPVARTPSHILSSLRRRLDMTIDPARTTKQFFPP